MKDKEIKSGEIIPIVLNREPRSVSEVFRDPPDFGGNTMSDEKKQPNKLYKIPFLGGGEPGGVMLEILYASNDMLVGANGLCAYCNGDPCAENSGPDTHIGAYFARNKWADTCPCCKGSAS